jgi:hypothetical protein
VSDKNLKLFSLILKMFNYYVKMLQFNGYKLGNSKITTFEYLVNTFNVFLLLYLYI